MCPPFAHCIGFVERTTQRRIFIGTSFVFIELCSRSLLTSANMCRVRFQSLREREPT